MTELVTVTIDDFEAEDIERLRLALAAAEDACQPVLPVYVSTPGGSLHGLRAMLDLIESAAVKVATIGLGVCASAGAVLLAAGERGSRFIAPRGEVMVHSPSTGMDGQTKPHDLREMSNRLDAAENGLFSDLDRLTSKAPGYWARRLKRASHGDLWFDAGAAVKNGLADIVGIPKLQRSVEYSLSWGQP